MIIIPFLGEKNLSYSRAQQSTNNYNNSFTIKSTHHNFCPGTGRSLTDMLQQLDSRDILYNSSANCDKNRKSKYNIKKCC